MPSPDFQILKLHPEMAKPNRAESPEATRAPVDPAPPRSQDHAEDKETLQPALKAREETAQPSLIRSAEGATPQTQPQRTHTSPAETFALQMGEAVKTNPGSAHAETIAARPNPVFSQVEGSIRWILQNKAQGAELQLHPESLGRMLIQLRVAGQEVHARLWASEASSLPILQEHKAFLEASLKEQGLHLGSFDLHFGARHDQPQTASQERVMGAASSLAVAEAKQEIPSKGPSGGPLDSLDPHQIEVYA